MEKNILKKEKEKEKQEYKKNKEDLNLKENKELKFKNQSILAIVIVTIFMCILIVVQVKALDKDELSERTPKNTALTDQYLKSKTENEKLLETLEKEEQNLQFLRNETSKNNEELEKIENEINYMQEELGQTEKIGRGIEITLSDSTQKKNPDEIQNIVHDLDLIELVNILKNASAEAISINGQRVIYCSPISCIGTVVTVNDVKLASPFVISAVGDPDVLETAITMPGGIGEIFKNLGLNLKIEQKNEMKLPKYLGVFFESDIK